MSLAYYTPGSKPAMPTQQTSSQQATIFQSQTNTQWITLNMNWPSAMKELTSSIVGKVKTCNTCGNDVQAIEFGPAYQHSVVFTTAMRSTIRTLRGLVRRAINPAPGVQLDGECERTACDGNKHTVNNDIGVAPKHLLVSVEVDSATTLTDQIDVAIGSPIQLKSVRRHEESLNYEFVGSSFFGRWRAVLTLLPSKRRSLGVVGDTLVEVKVS